MTLLKMSFYGAVIILVILIIRAFTLHRLPKRTFLILWGVALLRLLVPFEIASGFSLYSLLPTREEVYAPDSENLYEPFQSYAEYLKTTASSLTETDNTTIVDQSNDSIYLPDETLNDEAALLPNVNTELQTASETTLQNQTVPYLPVLWMIGVLLCAVFFLVSYIRCHLEFSTSLPVTEEYATEWLKQHPLKRTISLCQSDKISAPLTYGIFRPVILLPKKTDWNKRTQLDYVLYHEFTHIRRFDPAAKLVMIAAVCLHWFNPFVWAMYFFFNRDLELSCDDSVVKHFNEEKSAYANTLIGMMEKKNFSTPLCNHFSRNAIEERITAIMKSKKTTVGMIIAAVVIVVIVAITLTTGRKNEDLTSDVTPSAAPTETVAPTPSVEPTPAPDQLIWLPETNYYYDSEAFRCTTNTISPELGYTFVIESLITSPNHAWSDISIDLAPYAEGKTWWCMAVFWDADTNCVYLEFVPSPSAKQDLTDAGILHVTIPFHQPEDYTVIPFGSGAELKDDALWFSEIRKIKNRIYFNCGSCNGTLWAIDITGNELLDLSYVNEKMQALANELCAGFDWGHEPDLWFSATRQEEGEVMVYSASVCKEMDTGTVFTLLLYYENDTFLHHTVTYTSEDWYAIVEQIEHGISPSNTTLLPNDTVVPDHVKDALHTQTTSYLAECGLGASHDAEYFAVCKIDDITVYLAYISSPYENGPMYFTLYHAYRGEELFGKVIQLSQIPFHDTEHPSHIQTTYINIDDVVRMAKEEFEKLYNSKNYNQPYQITSIHMTSNTEIQVEFLLSESQEFEIYTEGTVEFTYDYDTKAWSISSFRETPPDYLSSFASFPTFPAGDAVVTETGWDLTFLDELYLPRYSQLKDAGASFETEAADNHNIGMFHTAALNGILYFFVEEDADERDVHAWHIAISSPDYPLSGGAKVGMNVEELLALYPDLAKTNLTYDDPVFAAKYGPSMFNFRDDQFPESFLAEYEYAYVAYLDKERDGLPVCIAFLIKNDQVGAITVYMPTAG